MEKLLYIAGPLSTQWERIAESLQLTQREIADCRLKGGVDPREGCYQMLCYWLGKDPVHATVAQLANGLWNANCGGLLKHLQ